MMANPRVLAVILNYRTAEMTLRSAEAALVALDGIDGALVVVDNASGDGSFETMARAASARGWDKGPRPVRVLQAGRNGGYGAGNNFGMRAGMPDGGRPDFVYILNPDAFPEPAAIGLLLDHLLAHPQTGIAGSCILDEDGTAQRAAFRFPSIAAEFESQIRFGPVSKLLHRWVVAPPPPDATGPVNWVAGASMLMRQDMLDRVGGFDEGFFLYFEETDLCRRALVQGWACDYVRQSRVRHIGAVSTGKSGWRRTPDYWFDSRLRYFRKAHGVIYATAATLSHLAGGILWQVRRLLQNKPRNDPPWYLWDLTRHALRSLWSGGRNKMR